MNGVLLLDKPSGCTSHDVVQRMRKALGTRAVGHAGTLDPLATGVLVVAVGEATKLVSYLQAADKAYEVTAAVGVATDTLDADGQVVGAPSNSTLVRSDLEEAVAGLLGTHPQTVPVFSAVKVDGKALHRRARAGENVTAPTRDVTLHEAQVLDVGEGFFRLGLRCSKGFFVRSLVRDLAESLGTVAHVTALRRTASGDFGIDGAVPEQEWTRELLAQRMLPLREAAAALGSIRVNAEGAEHAFHGRRIPPSCVVQSQYESDAEPLAVFEPSGELIAIARNEEVGFKIVRGFRAHR